MTDMTDTKIAAAVAELTEAIKAKGYPEGHAYIDFNICGYGGWYARLDRSITQTIRRTERHTSARAALDEAKGIVDALPINDPQARSAEALRAALSAAREAGVDVSEIMEAGK